MIRWPLIAAELQRPWCATPAVIEAIGKAVRRKAGIDSGSTEASSAKSAPRPSASKVSAANGAMTTVSLQEESAEKAVAVIPVFGVIGKYLSYLETECGGFDLCGLERNLRRAEADPAVTHIVLHISSPGGTITGTAEAAQLIAQVNQTKPVFAYTDSQMCSAAYWLGCSGSAVFASEFATVGSIGVYLAWIDESKAMENEGLELKLFRDGTFKASTLPGQLTEEAGKMLQDEVDAIGSAFRSHVTASRKASSDTTVSVETMQGQTFFGQKAIDAGLVDGNYRSLHDLLLDILNQKGTP